MASLLYLDSPALGAVASQTRRSQRPRRLLLDTTTAHDCNNTHSNLDSSVGTAPPPLLQEDYRIGASVYDRSHNNNPRGYGEISRRASPDDNGNPRYYIAFSTGQRITAMKETYLELSHIHHRDRVPATALQQRILVVLGTHKGKSGLTIAKVGQSWKCRLDDVQGAHAFSPDSLHATEAAAEEHELAPFEPILLTTLPAPSALPDWLYDKQYSSDSPIDLRRMRISQLWSSVLSQEQSVHGLSDDDVFNLHYEARGSYTNADRTPASLASIRAGLQQAAESNWSQRFVCSHHFKCNCPFAVEARHQRSTGKVEVWQTEAHRFHNPGSAADLKQLRMHPKMQAIVAMLLSCNVKPVQVQQRVNMMQLEAGNTLGTLGSSSRDSIILPQVYAEQEKLRREAGLGLTSDVQATAVQMAKLKEQGCCGLYQPYKERSGTQEQQPMIIVLQTPFMKRMLDQFGRRVVFMDGTGGTNKYGYMLYAVVVQDECGRGTPVAASWAVGSSMPSFSAASATQAAANSASMRER